MSSLHRTVAISAVLMAGLLLGISASAQAQVLVPAATAQRIDKVFAAYAKPGSPGCALALLDKGRSVYEKGYGLASIEFGVAIDPQKTAFEIASISKQFTATSILLLVRDHKISLDDDIRTYVPELPDYGTKVTLRHLLNHTSGIADYPTLMAISGINAEDVSTDDDALRVLSRHGLDFVPGSEFSYSNSGYFLLSRVVRRVTGQPLRDYAQQHIFEPLGMTHTRILDDHTAVVANRAMPYDGSDGKFARAASNWEQTGDTGVQTTLGDLAKWDQNFYDGKVGGAWMIEQLQTQGRLNDGRTIPYALGLVVDNYRGVRSVVHSGWQTGFKSYFVRFPDQHVSAIALCNVESARPDRLVRQVADIYLHDVLVPVVASKPALPDEMQSHAGLYVDASRGMVRSVAVHDDRSWYIRADRGENELNALGDGRFEVVGEATTISFLGGIKGETRRLLVDDVSVTGAGVTQLEEMSVAAPDVSTLHAAEGVYISTELDTRLSLAVADGQLTLRPERGSQPLPLPAAFTDAFILPGGLLRLERGQLGQITGFTMNFPDARNLKFTRIAESK